MNNPTITATFATREARDRFRGRALDAIHCYLAAEKTWPPLP